MVELNEYCLDHIFGYLTPVEWIQISEGNKASVEIVVIFSYKNYLQFFLTNNTELVLVKYFKNNNYSKIIIKK